MKYFDSILSFLLAVANLVFSKKECKACSPKAKKCCDPDPGPDHGFPPETTG